MVSALQKKKDTVSEKKVLGLEASEDGNIEECVILVGNGQFSDKKNGNLSMQK